MGKKLQIEKPHAFSGAPPPESANLSFSDTYAGRPLFSNTCGQPFREGAWNETLAKKQ
jgi:hypothetical protein